MLNITDPDSVLYVVNGRHVSTVSNAGFMSLSLIARFSATPLQLIIAIASGVFLAV